jgi:hypothetical protein
MTMSVVATAGLTEMLSDCVRAGSYFHSLEELGPYVSLLVKLTAPQLSLCFDLPSLSWRSLVLVGCWLSLAWLGNIGCEKRALF